MLVNWPLGWTNTDIGTDMEQMVLDLEDQPDIEPAILELL